LWGKAAVRTIPTKRSKTAFIHANLPTDGKFAWISEGKAFEIVRPALTVSGFYRAVKPA
jgi:hypothetical protein